MTSAPSHARKGSTLIDVLMIVAILGIVGNFSVPMYRRYQVLADLNVVLQQTEQALGRARTLAQTGELDSEWGFYVPAGILYKGTSFAGHDPSYDEVYPVPDTVGAAGLLDVSFSKMLGVPSVAGTIELTSLFGERRTVVVSVGSHGTSTVGDRFTICHQAGTPQQSEMIVNDSSWTAHRAHGDHLGICKPLAVSSSSNAASSVTASSASAPATSSSASTASSLTSSGAGGGGAASSSSACDLYFYTNFINFYDATSADIRIELDSLCDDRINEVSLPGCEVRGSHIVCDDMLPMNYAYTLSFVLPRTESCIDPLAVVRVQYNNISNRRLPDSQNLIISGTCIIIPSSSSSSSVSSAQASSFASSTAASTATASSAAASSATASSAAAAVSSAAASSPSGPSSNCSSTGNSGPSPCAVEA